MKKLNLSALNTNINKDLSQTSSVNSSEGFLADDLNQNNLNIQEQNLDFDLPKNSNTEVVDDSVVKNKKLTLKDLNIKVKTKNVDSINTQLENNSGLQQISDEVKTQESLVAPKIKISLNNNSLEFIQLNKEEITTNDKELIGENDNKIDSIQLSNDEEKNVLLNINNNQVLEEKSKLKEIKIMDGETNINVLVENKQDIFANYIPSVLPEKEKQRLAEKQNKQEKIKKILLKEEESKKEEIKKEEVKKEEIKKEEVKKEEVLNLETKKLKNKINIIQYLKTQRSNFSRKIYLFNFKLKTKLAKTLINIGESFKKYKILYGISTGMLGIILVFGLILNLDIGFDNSLKGNVQEFNHKNFKKEPINTDEYIKNKEIIPEVTPEVIPEVTQDTIIESNIDEDDLLNNQKNINDDLNNQNVNMNNFNAIDNNIKSHKIKRELKEFLLKKQ